MKKANVTDSTHSIWYWQQYEEVEIYSGVQMFISSKTRFFFCLINSYFFLIFHFFFYKTSVINIILLN